jgi:TatD DNase family protein
MLIDSHVNLHAPQFAEDQAEVIARARAAGIGLMVTICDKVSSFEAVHAIAMAHDDIWATVGTHPHEAKENPAISADTLIQLASRPKVVGIGECGLDFHYDLSPRDIQAQVFRVHIKAAQETGLPLVAHTREADAVMAEILREEHARAPFKS